MSIEELLKPRFKVIANAPRMSYNVGRILTPINEGSNQYDCADAPSSELIAYPEKYPSIFKKLEWWEERDENDMPEYVKFSKSPIVWKIKKWHYKWFNQPIPEIEEINGEWFSINHHFDKNDMLPSTKEQYEQYNSKNEKPEL